MRILQVITRSELGGAQSVVINLSNSLINKNEVIVVAGDKNGKMWDLLDSRIKREPIKYLKRNLSFFYDFITVIIFLRLYLKYKPDIIHLHSSKMGVLGRLVFPSGKIVYTVHGFDSIRIAYRRFLPLEKWLQKKCRAIVGVSEYDKRNLLCEGVTNHVEAVYNGIIAPVPLGKDPFEHLHTYKKKILCIARLSPPKNLAIFLKVATLLPDYAFIWIGNQHEVPEQQAKNIFFMGSLPDAGAYNEYADLFILPSNYEGLPMTIIEAMAFGKPVVASKVGGISEIIIDDVNGYTVENSAQAFCEKISYILENDEIYARFSKNALQCYREKLTIDKMVNGYLSIYDKILKGESRD